MSRGAVGHAPDEDTFTCLRLAYEAARRGGTLGAVMSGANEEAVAMFLDGKIGFYDIYDLVYRAMREVPHVEKPTLEQILTADAQARQSVKRGPGPIRV